MSTEKKMHPGVPYLQEQLQQGKVSRREFIRYACLLGTSVAAASTMAAAATPAWAAAPALGALAQTEEEKPLWERIQRGGTLRLASQVQKVTHPAQFSWVSPSNQLRQVAEYLTYTDGYNITHPYLLESWETSEDLTEWTLNLRQRINWNNGDLFTADDVIFTMGQWLDEDVGSSMLGLMSYLSPNDIEKVDCFTVKLYLSKPEIGVPEHMFHYPALVLNANTFEGDFLKAPVGTGPYTLEDFKEGERVLLKRRDDYWQMGADCESLPYLDEMEFIDMGEDMTAWVAALKAGEVDILEEGDTSQVDTHLALKDDPNITSAPITTCQTRVLRMRVDLDPWTDENVRMALKLCQDHEKILELAYFGEGLPGQDFHVYPFHPAYCEKPAVKFDPEQAKALLEEAGYPDGLDVEIAVGSGWTDIVSYAEILKEDAMAGGFNISINTMPNSQYWEQWTEVDLGITPWTHRPLDTMILNLAYTADEFGDPVAWNESRWVDDEFSELLAEANATLDVSARRQIMCQLEDIQYERGSIGIPFWKNIWFHYVNDLQDVPPHPTWYMLFNKVWKKQEEA